MADDDVATPALDPQASEPQQVETPELETEVEEGEPLGEDEDELEFGFKKYRVPKELKSAVEDMRADATNKHKDAAARQKALDDREASIKQQAEASEAEIEARAQLHGVKAELAKFAKLTAEDWAAHRRQDPMSTADAERYEAILRNKQAELEQELGHATNERTQRAQSDLTKRVEQTLAEAPKIIGSSWKGAETITKVAKFLNEDIGIPETVITQNWGPQLLRLGHLASIGLDLTKKVAAKPASAATPAQPLQTVRATSQPPPAGLSDRLSPDEWVKRREAQIRKRRAS
jgi:hypothetical protein